MRIISCLLVLFSFHFANSNPSDFIDGVKAYEAKDFEKAKEIFQPLLSQYPNNPTLLYNSGLVEFQLGRSGLALALWRKARFLDQSAGEIRAAIDYTEEMLFPDSDKGPLATLYDWLAQIPLHFWLFISFISFFPACWHAIKHGVKRSESIPHWPIWIFLSLPIFIFSFCFAIILNSERTKPKATVIEKNLLTHTGPSESSPTLSELNEGEIVYIKKIHGSWAQVKTQRGNPGWVLQTKLIPFGEGKL